MKKIIYIGNFDFNKMNAQAQLVYGNGLILKKLGYEVIYVGSSEKKTTDLFQKDIKYKGFKIKHIQFDKSVSMLIRSRYINKMILEELDSFTDVSYIITYGTPLFSNFLMELKKYSNKRMIPIISNSVDIPSTHHGKLYERVIKGIYVKRKREFQERESDGLIAVSNYIAKKLNIRNLPCIVIPPLKDYSEIEIDASFQDSSITNFVYAGIPFPIDGRKVDVRSYKDRLDIVIDMMLMVEKKNSDFKFNIYGLTKEQYTHVVRRHQRVLEENKKIVFHGNVNSKLVSEFVAKASYTINYRDNNEMSLAGFSTKVVESISNGVPVITSRVGDYESYLVEGRDVFYLDKTDIEGSINLILDVMSKSPNEQAKIKKRIHDSAKFHYNNYVDLMSDFIMKVRK